MRGKRKCSCAGRRVARAEDAPSRDALRRILRGDAKRALDCALPALGTGHTHEEQAARGARGVRATVFSRYSSGHLPSGVEEDCKGEIGCGWCHSFAGTIPPESVELSEASRQVLPSPNGACRERHARARARYHCFDWLEIWLHAKTSKVTPGHTLLMQHRTYRQRCIDSHIPNIAYAG